MADASSTEWFDRPGGEPVELAASSAHWPIRAQEWITVLREALAQRQVLPLRGHRETAAAYAALKKGLAADFGGDRGAYTDGKAAFIQGVIARATGRS